MRVDLCHAAQRSERPPVLYRAHLKRDPGGDYGCLFVLTRLETAQAAPSFVHGALLIGPGIFGYLFAVDCEQLPHSFGSRTCMHLDGLRVCGYEAV
jgi:hypothetical protein